MKMMMKASNRSSYCAVLITILTFVLKSNQQQPTALQTPPSSTPPPPSSSSSSSSSSTLEWEDGDLLANRTINLIMNITSNYPSILDIPLYELNKTTILEIVKQFNSSSKKLHELALQYDNITDKQVPTVNGTYYSSNSIDPTVSLWPIQIILIVVYSAMAILSLSLNIISILVMIRKDRSISTELWKFLVNLSAADIGMAIFCIPFTYTEVMLNQWIFPHWFCPVLRFAQNCFVFVSVWTLTIIGIDRYFAIVHPLYLFHWIRSHKSGIIYTIWASGMVFGMGQYSFTEVQTIKGGETMYKCTESLSLEQSRVYTIGVFILVFAGPVVILVFVYATISFRILEQVTPGNPDSFRDRQQLHRKIKVLKMLATIVGLFALCWLPIHLVQLTIEFDPSILRSRSTQRTAFYIAYFTAHFLSMAHSFVNPIVYCFMSDNFRLNLRHMVARYLNWMKSCDSSSSRPNTLVCPTTSGGFCSGCVACTRCAENIELARLQGSSLANFDSAGIGRTYTTFNTRTNKTFTKVAISELGATQQTPIATVTHYSDLLSGFNPNNHTANNNNNNCNGYLNTSNRQNFHTNGRWQSNSVACQQLQIPSQNGAQSDAKQNGKCTFG